MQSRVPIYRAYGKGSPNENTGRLEMNEYLRQMIAKGHAEVETYPLAQMQGKVNQILNYRDFLDLLKTSKPYNEPSEWWDLNLWLRRN